MLPSSKRSISMKWFSMLKSVGLCVVLAVLVLSILTIISIPSESVKSSNEQPSNQSKPKKAGATKILINKAQKIQNETESEPVVYDNSIFDEEDIIIAPGNPNLIPRISVHGAIVSTGHHLPPKNKNEYEYINRRISNARSFAKQLPFEVTEWSGVFTRPCPTTPDILIKTERGVALAHYRIWSEFVYFDPHVIEEYKFNEFSFRNLSDTSTSVKSADGVFEIFHEGTMFKNKLRYSDKDIMVVFEDDAKISIKDFNSTLLKELTNMEADLVLLGFTQCLYMNTIQALTTHAYAVTREGAKKLMQHYEPCGASVDLQFAILNHQKHFKYRTAKKESYFNNQINGLKPPIKIKCGDTLGMLIQNKIAMGTINGHLISEGESFGVKR